MQPKHQHFYNSISKLKISKKVRCTYPYCCLLNKIIASETTRRSGCKVLLINRVLFNTCVIFSRLCFGFLGASVRRTGCSSGATRSSL